MDINGAGLGLLPTYKYAIAEIPLLATASGNIFNFPTNNYITGRKIFAIECYIDTDISKSPISTSNATWTTGQMQKASITIHCFDPTRPNDNSAASDWIKQLPVAMLHRSQTSDSGSKQVAVMQQMIFPGINIDYNNSNITFVESMSFDKNYSALFGFYYM